MKFILALFLTSCLLFTATWIFNSCGRQNYDDWSLETRANHGDPDAEYHLGYRLLMTPTPNAEICSQAIALFEKAGNQGHAEAQLYVSKVYNKMVYGCLGKDTPKNPKEAYYWTLLAQKTQIQYPTLPGHLTSDVKPNDFGIPEAIKEYEHQLSPGQIAAIRKRVEEWNPNSQ
jgi:hypothetical protein